MLAGAEADEQQEPGKEQETGHDQLSGASNVTTTPCHDAPRPDAQQSDAQQPDAQQPDAQQPDAQGPGAPQQEISFSAQELPEAGIDASADSIAPASSQQNMGKPRVQLVTSADAGQVPPWQKHRNGIHLGSSMPTMSGKCVCRLIRLVLCVAVYVAVKEHFDKRKRRTDQCICGLSYNNQVAEIAEEMGLYNDPALLDRILSIVSVNPNCIPLEEMCVSS